MQGAVPNGMGFLAVSVGPCTAGAQLGCGCNLYGNLQTLTLVGFQLEANAAVSFAVPLGSIPGGATATVQTVLLEPGAPCGFATTAASSFTTQ